ncbi:MAG TPA: GNAT family N-acetyltransferase [Ktedonobacteraceae bacterium]|nr:GNAT family N-acetyltransferase [Ktedonobacteraceae bacterium]
MDGGTPHIDVRAICVDDAAALHALDYSFETDRIYQLRTRGNIPQESSFAFELVETHVDPPHYHDYREYEGTLSGVETRLRNTGGGYIALADGQVVGAILLDVEEWRSVARIGDLLVGRQFRRYGIGSLLLSCASDWARKHNCWAIILETQNVNYPAIQFYLRNGLEIWSIQRHFYPPGLSEHEVAIFMGKRLWSAP